MTGNAHTNGSTTTSPQDVHPPFSVHSPYMQQDQQRPVWSLPVTAPPMIPTNGNSIPRAVPEMVPLPPQVRALNQTGLNPADASPLLSRGTTSSGQDEEAVVYSNTRMLQDPSGRLCQSSSYLHVELNRDRI
jgi:hypothetical protein